MLPLSLLSPETAHAVTCKGLRWLHACGISRLLHQPIDMPVESMGLAFANPVGIAAGLDKNGDYIDAFGALGVGFIEVGTVTPKAQLGNPKPRLFRLPEERAVINRMGFNNKGVLHLVKRLQKKRYQGIVGVNVGKNKNTPLNEAHKDYQYCIEQVYPWCDYIVLNISSPNTQGLRDLQNEEHMTTLLEAVQETHFHCAYKHKKYKPLVVKMSPDLRKRHLRQFIGIINQSTVDGLVVSNTTLLRRGVAHARHAEQKGGLSGAPLFAQSTKLLLQLRPLLDERITLIGSGGVLSGADVLAKMRAGAALVQVYTGLVYRGLGLLRDISASCQVHHATTTHLTDNPNKTGV